MYYITSVQVHCPGSVDSTGSISSHLRLFSSIGSYRGVIEETLTAAVGDSTSFLVNYQQARGPVVIFVFCLVALETFAIICFGESPGPWGRWSIRVHSFYVTSYSVRAP